ncbi:HNH endonuclease [Armatimonas sp.]|uniref:HNH endonuclease n=1 Tax=Armatimonas sp. TaxID=1872638 RepID=UPI0037501BE9
MSTTYIPLPLRREVRERARNRCEYCGIHENDTQFGCEVDHILSEKHGGLTITENLALACFFCNRNKGSDIGSVRDSDDPTLIRFFNPRTDLWETHFEEDSQIHIVGKTDIGRVTVRIFGFNAENRILERQALR